MEKYIKLLRMIVQFIVNGPKMLYKCQLSTSPRKKWEKEKKFIPGST